MKKEEILAKSRASKCDEGFEFAENKGNKLGHIVLTVYGVFIVLVAALSGEIIALVALGTVLCAFSLVQSIVVYRSTKRKIYLVGATISGFMTPFLFVWFAVHIWGVWMERLG